MKDCESCVHEHLSPMSDTCRECGLAMLNYEERKPMTNADRIRAMDDAELTRFFAENCGCDDWCMHKRSGACASKSENECCLDVWYRWLKSPMEE